MSALRRIGLSTALLAIGAFAFAKPPEDPQARKVYDHNYDWLKKFPAPFVAANVRGEGMQYAERRMAALDLVKVQRDFGVVSELMTALDNNSFLSADIIEVLTDWKARRSLPLLKKISEDPARPPEIREQAKKAYAAISNAPIDRPPAY